MPATNNALLDCLAPMFHRWSAQSRECFFYLGDAVHFEHPLSDNELLKKCHDRHEFAQSWAALYISTLSSNKPANLIFSRCAESRFGENLLYYIC